MEDLEVISIKIHDAIFSDTDHVKIEDSEIPVKTFSSGLRYVDYSNYRYVEQNSNKSSHWAKKAREGHQITWIFEGRKYIGQIFDGKFKLFGDKIT
ncbi:MAG: hypothetical protein EU549_04335 [Promethearchaeota archaeon]|nr:MAG: hypothetical protein EU549_04335 [Candidatus Lokiarchaeota archaeon]